MANNNGFSVLDMADEYAQDHDIDPAEIFRKNPVTGNVKAELESEEAADAPKEVPDETSKKKEKRAWTPDASLTEGMDELNTSTGVVYDKDDIKIEPDSLANIADEGALKVGEATHNDLDIKTINIEKLKARHHIKHLHIPEGEARVRMLIAAGDPNHAQEKLDEILEEIAITYPSWIEYDNGFIQPTPNTREAIEMSEADDHKGEVGTNDADFTGYTHPDEKSKPSHVFDPVYAHDVMKDMMNPETTKVIIDKRNVPDISWSQEEVDKIKKSRTIELNIVEGTDIEFGEIKDVDTSSVDAVLAQYQRKTNDIVVALPASHYRATFTGLTFPEVIDLSSSNEMNNLDGERKKWSICFNHIKNQTIGPWEEYVLYKDPATGKTVKASTGAHIPDGIKDSDIEYVTKFEDFLRKTSYIDLEFMLWKILCATSMSKEVVSITCNAVGEDGKKCGNNYDWIYSPADLLAMDSINPAVLEEMKQTGEASTPEEIERVYKTSPVCASNYVTLHSSGFKPIYGHISAYEYLNGVYSKIEELRNPETIDPTVVSRALSYNILTSVKAFLIPDGNGGYQRISGTENIIKVLDILDEIDWQTLNEINNLMVEPYQFRYSMRDVVCPKCKNRSVIPITNMDTLLFIIARSLSSVSVTLKRT